MEYPTEMFWTKWGMLRLRGTYCKYDTPDGEKKFIAYHAETHWYDRDANKEAGAPLTINGVKYGLDLTFEPATEIFDNGRAERKTSDHWRKSVSSGWKIGETGLFVSWNNSRFGRDRAYNSGTSTDAARKVLDQIEKDVALWLSSDVAEDFRKKTAQAILTQNVEEAGSYMKHCQDKLAEAQEKLRLAQVEMKEGALRYVG